MDMIETQVQRTSPILRVTTDISEYKSRDSKDDIRISETTRSVNSGEANLRHASNLLSKKKQLRPLFSSQNPYRSSSYFATSAYSIHPNSKSNVSMFTQRIMSAKLLRVKQLQNELKETQIQLHEAKNENRLLKTLHKRQDNALKKYEGDQAQLPQLIKSHNEELRVISTQYKQLKASYRDLELKLRQRETELANLKEQHRHLVKLSRDKNLGHRERLAKQVEDLKETVKEQNERIQMLTRRVELEGKNYKHQLNVEMAKHKDTQAELTMAHETIESLKNLIEAKDKYINNAVPNRFYKPPGNTGPVSQVFSTTSMRFRNIPKTAGPVVIQGERESEDTINSTSLDPSSQDTDATLEELSFKNSPSKMIKNRIRSDLNRLNLRKKLSNRKVRIKSDQVGSNVIKKDKPKEGGCTLAQVGGEAVERKFHSSEWNESITLVGNNSCPGTVKDSSRREANLISNLNKTKRSVSIDSGRTLISNNTLPNDDDDDSKNSNNYDDDEYDDNEVSDKNLQQTCDSRDSSSDGNKSDDKKKTSSSKQTNKFGKLRRNSVSICESDSPLESISSSVIRAQAKDRLLRQKSIKNELKELEERLKKCNSKYTLEKNSSFESLLDTKAQSVKDELKEFEERLLNSSELKAYSSSISKTFEEEADKIVRKVATGIDILPCDNSDNGATSDNEGDLDNGNVINEVGKKKFDLKDISVTWNTIREELQREKENSESTLEEYYDKMSKNESKDYSCKENDGEDNKSDEQKKDEDLELDEGQKLRLLKALNEIDLQETGRKGSIYSSDGERKDQWNSLNLKYNYNLNSNENLTNIKSQYDYEFSRIKEVSNVNGDISQNFDRNKTDLMEELFGSVNAFSSKQDSTKNLGDS